MKKIRPVDNVVIVKPLDKKDSFSDKTEKAKFHVDEMQEIEEAKVISKGKECKGDYNIGDVVGYVMGQRYIAGDKSFIHDEDVRYVIEE